jgi:arginyl-tRNA synthetase
MGSSLLDRIKGRITQFALSKFNVALDNIASEVPPRIELGDLAFPVAFELSKRVKAATGQKANPRELANQLAEILKSEPGISRVEIAGAGYLNVFLDRPEVFNQLVAGTAEPAARAGDKLIVEHTSINPNKAAHIGHVRNSVLGDSISRILRSTGENIEVHNYIDNTGVQVADVVIGFLYLERKLPAEIEKLAGEGRFDYYCWDLYARVGAWYEEDKSRFDLRARTLHEIEAGEGIAASVAERVSSRIVDCHLNTMARLEITYDLMARESEILHLHFWAQAFEKLKEGGAIVFETEGRNRGCWVMRSQDTEAAPDESEDETEHDIDKIIVRSNGTVTYTGKDIAYHLWKLGKLGLDFYYRLLREDNGHQVWTTTSNEALAESEHPPFGHGTAFLNVIDVGQSYPQETVKRGVMAIDHDEGVARSAHLAYEKVTLTPAAANELGMAISDADAQRQQIGMSGRKGLGVKADDLIDRLEANALSEVQSRHGDLDSSGSGRIAHQIAVAALRYFLLKYTRTSIIAFDFREALSFDGETGPYIQYSAVRANNIFRKIGRTPEQVRADYASCAAEQVAELFDGQSGQDIWSLVSFAARLEEMVGVAAANFEPTHVAKYAFQLAKQFNLFYHSHHILSEPDASRQTLLLMVVDMVRGRLEKALSLLGIEVPERM